MLEKDMPNCIHQNHVFRVRLNQEKVNPVFFAKYLLTSDAKMYFLKSAKRTTNLASINIGQLKKLPVSLPPLKLQTQFATRVAKINALLEQQTKMLETAEQTTAALMDKYFA